MVPTWYLARNGEVTEEVVLSKIDTAFGYEVPVKLLTYPDGSMDLFRQQGNQFRDHLIEAKALLQERGLLTGKVELMSPTGGYLPVWKKPVGYRAPGLALQAGYRALALQPFTGYAALVASEDMADNPTTGARRRIDSAAITALGT